MQCRCAEAIKASVCEPFFGRGSATERVNVERLNVESYVVVGIKFWLALTPSENVRRSDPRITKDEPKAPKGDQRSHEAVRKPPTWTGGSRSTRLVPNILGYLWLADVQTLYRSEILS